MELADAIDVLKDGVLQHDRLQVAFRTALRTREQWPILDLLDYRDICQDGQVNLPESTDWTVDVDVITKPKQNGGIRVERLVDIFTGTLLQVVANELSEREQRQPSSLNTPFMPIRLKGQNSYEAWAKMVTSWLRQQLGKGKAVLIVDFADFFPSIRPEQIYRAITAAGLSADVAEAVLLIFDLINNAPGGDGSRGKGLPIIPDEIAWTIADLVLRPFDEETMRQLVVSDYMRWVDDCFIACDAERSDDALRSISDLAKDFGFRLNPAKARIFLSLDDQDRAMLQREHNLLDDLFAIALVDGGELNIMKFLPQLTARLISGRAEHARVVKRLYNLATLTCSMEMLSNAARDLDEYPAAERQILTYLSRLRWPFESHELLLRSLIGDSCDSRQLFALRLLLDAGPSYIPAAARDACERIVNGELPAHQFARTLAFAALIDDASDAGRRSLRHFAGEISGLTSTMARRVGLELLSLVDSERVDWSAFSRDTSPLVRRFVEFSSSPLRHRALASLPTKLQRPVLTWGGLEERLMRRLGAEVS